MKKFFTLFFGGVMLLVSATAFSQNVTQYSFSTSTGASLDPMSGATTVVGSNVDDTPSGLQAIGFNFVYEGVTYTQYSASPDGFIRLGNTAASSQFTNSMTSTTNLPKIAPLWDDYATGTTGNVTTVLSGTAPTQIRIIQWFITIPRATGGVANSTMQLWLYEGSNNIEFRYGSGGTSASASCGLVGASTAPVQYNSVTTATHTASTTTANNTNTAWPGSGRMYTFVPPVPCSGTPNAGTTAATVTSGGCGSFTSVLSLTGASSGVTGLTYQWESSADNVTYAPIAGATSATYTATVAATTWYRCTVSCTPSGQSASSVPLQITLNGVTGGTTTIAGTGACSGVNFTVSLTGASTTGVTYQWQSSPDGVTYTNVASGGTSATYTANQTAATWYQCILTCTSTSTTATSVPLQVNMNNFYNCYCVPTSSGSGCVTNVTVGTINNTTTGCASGNYSQQSATTTLEGAVTYPFTVTTDASAIVSVWIDYNRNGIFESTEWAQVFTTGTTATINVTVPANAGVGLTGMRIRSRLTGNANGAGDACNSFGSGECEDYVITLAASTACSGTPAPGATNSTATSACTGVNFTLSLANPGTTSGLTYQWQSSPDNTTYTDITGATNMTLTTTQTATTWYRCNVTCSNSSSTGTSTPIEVTQNAPVNCYCVTGLFTTGCSDDDDINSFTFGTAFDHQNTGCTGGLNIADFTTSQPAINVVQGDTYSFTVTTEYTALEYFEMWVDFNDDGFFDDAGDEHIYNGTTAFTSTAPLTATVTIPATAQVGSHRMRARVTYNTPAALPCGTYSFGEIHDYTMTVAAPTPCSGVNPGNTVATPSSVCWNNGAVALSISGSNSGSGISYQWQSSPDNSTWTDISGATSFVYNTTVTANTWFRCVVSCSATSSSLASTAAEVTVTAEPAGNSSATAIAITSFPYTNTANTATGCFTNNYTGQASADVFYSFNSGACNDSVIVSTCASGFDTYIYLLDAATNTIVASNDDNGPICSGSTASLKSVLTPNTDYYIVTEGYNTLTGAITVDVSLVVNPTMIAYYTDNDGDTYGNPATEEISCTGVPTGFVANGDDCNDDDAAVNPAATEVCANTIDENCDGSLSKISSFDYTIAPSCLNGKATVTITGVTGGTAPYLYSKNGGTTYVTNPVFTLISIGTTNFAVKDAEQCDLILPVTVNPIMVLTASGTDITCFGANDGVASVAIGANQGYAPYEYSWTLTTTTGTVPAGTTQSISNLIKGTYKVTVTDSKGCTKSTTRVVKEPVDLKVTLKATAPSCFGGNNGSISNTVTGGTGSKTYLWNDGNTDEDRFNLSAGVYTVTTTDANGCTKSGTVVVANPPALTLTFTITNVSCNGGSNGIAKATSTGGTGAKTFAWSNGAAGSTASGLNAGTYTCTVTDSKGCTLTGTATVTQPTPVQITGITSTGNGPFTVTVTATGGTPLAGAPGYKFRRLTPDGVTQLQTSTTGIFSNVPAGTYMFEAKDAKLCPGTQVQSIPVTLKPIVNDRGNTPASGINFALTPNPTKQSFFVTFDGTVTSGDIELRDAAGSLVKRIPVAMLTAQGNRVALDGVAAGVLFVTYRPESGLPTTKRLVVIE